MKMVPMITRTQPKRNEKHQLGTKGQPKQRDKMCIHNQEDMGRRKEKNLLFKLLRAFMPFS